MQPCFLEEVKKSEEQDGTTATVRHSHRLSEAQDRKESALSGFDEEMLEQGSHIRATQAFDLLKTNAHLKTRMTHTRANKTERDLQNWIAVCE